MAKYIINYGNGVTKETTAASIDGAKKAADEMTSYTQHDITIRDSKGKAIYLRQWWGTAYDPAISDETESDIISFGDAGYYGAWQALETTKEPVLPDQVPKPAAGGGVIGKPPPGYKLNPVYLETKSKRVNLLLQPSLAERMKRGAQKQGISVNELVSEAARKYLDEIGVE